VRNKQLTDDIDSQIAAAAHACYLITVINRLLHFMKNKNPHTSGVASEAKQRKIVQIATSQSREEENLYALCDDGTVWKFRWIIAEEPETVEYWAKLPAIS
jgi:hypothetical protein